MAPPACAEVTGVTISGPSTVTAGVEATFTAAATPLAATVPITYTWSPVPDSGQGTATAHYTWATAGVKTVSVTATNCNGSGTASDDHAVTVDGAGGPYKVYLPVVERGGMYR